MSKLYVYYQRQGGNDEWIPTQADSDLAQVKPTFVTVLALDTLLDDHPSRETLDAVKYRGPMYFDLDSADIADSIESGKQLAEKLIEAGLQDGDFEVYLSGKKGLHFIIPPICFMEKVIPVTKLPAVYKEIAFRLAVPATDFKVYTARKGRMLRTCYNIRENNNYRVPVSVTELRELTPETYDSLCKAPRPAVATTPRYRAQFALVYDAASQKIAGIKRKKIKPVTSAELGKAAPELAQILAGENLSDIGFNKIAMQLCIYAREANWSEDILVEKANGLLQNHASDGYRYNTPTKREHELRRMFSYVEDNPAYEYSIDFLKSCLTRPSRTGVTDSGEHGEGESETFVLSSGVNVRGKSYTVERGDDGEVEISNFIFTNSQTLHEPSDGRILAIRTQVGTETNVVLEPKNFTSSAALQNIISGFGKSFTGSDVHARGIYQIMLREVTKTSYIIGSEGMNFIKLPAHPDQEVANTPFLVWADRYRVATQAWLRERDVNLEFLGYPEDKGVIQTDLTNAPRMGEWLEGNRERLAECFRDLFKSTDVETLSRALGWMVAAHWAPLFHECFQKFPLLHVYGRAGSGKTELTTALLHLFYYQTEPKYTSPSASVFAFLTMLGGSGSIPILLDEWKPPMMDRNAVERYRSIFRSAYNAAETQRGGGNKGNSSFGALNTIKLSAPIIFMSEAGETEKAIVDRCVMLSFKRSSTRESGATLAAFRKFKANLEPLSILGKHIAGRILRDGEIEQFQADMKAMEDWTYSRYTVQPGDIERYESGELTKEAYDRKLKYGNEMRPLYNCTVVMFGLSRLRGILQELLGDLFDKDMQDTFRTLVTKSFTGLDASTNILPEYAQVLSALSDMTRLQTSTTPGDHHLIEGVDYNLSEVGGKSVLILATRFAYNKYRQYQRIIGQAPLYPNDVSFEQALKAVPQFMVEGTGCARMKVDTVVLDSDSLAMMGVRPFAGKPVPLPT